MAFSGTSTFEKFLSIDDIITESFERLGFFDYSGNDLRSARRNLGGSRRIRDRVGGWFNQFSQDAEFEIGGLSTQDLSQELVTPYHLLNERADKNQFFSYYNYSSNSFFSHGINGSWLMGIFQDPELRAKRNLRSQFSNPWLNFSATGTTFGSILKSNDRFDFAVALSAGRNKFKTNEIFGERN